MIRSVIFRPFDYHGVIEIVKTQKIGYALHEVSRQICV